MGGEGHLDSRHMEWHPLHEAHLMRIMLLGGAGFLGVNLATVLAQRAFDVSVVDKGCNDLARKQLAGHATFYQRDIGDVESLVKLIDEIHIDCVVNLVSTLLPSSSLEAFCTDISSCMAPSFDLVQRLAERKIRYVFFSSGGTIYGRTEHDAVEESDPCRPISFYGYSKLMFEEYLAFARRISGMDYLVIRPSNPYGPFQNVTRNQGLVGVVLDRLLKGQAIEIWGDGSVVRDYIWIGDLANAVVDILEKNLWNSIFNIGTGVGHSLTEVIEIAETVTGKKATTVFKSGRPVDVPRIVMDISKLKREISFSPMSLSEGIGLYYEEMADGQA